MSKALITSLAVSSAIFMALGASAEAASCAPDTYKSDIAWCLDMNCGINTPRCRGRDNLREGLRINDKRQMVDGFVECQNDHNPEGVKNGERCNSDSPDFLMNTVRSICSGPPCKTW
jgi:hypothetical protein